MGDFGKRQSVFGFEKTAMNNFYNQPKILQWIVAFILIQMCTLPALAILIFGYKYPILYLLLFFWIPIAQFSFSPFSKLIGIYTYYSPMLLGYMVTKEKIDLHSGSSFDYLFVMRKHKPGIEFRNRLLTYHLEGLINIIHQIENKTIPETVSITATSYFFNTRTLQNLGFDFETSTTSQKMNVYSNFLDLWRMHSLSRGKWSLPKFKDAKSARISGAKLVESKAYIEGLYRQLKLKTAV